MAEERTEVMMLARALMVDTLDTSSNTSMSTLAVLSAHSTEISHQTVVGVR